MALERKQTKKKEVVKLLDISIPSNILDVLLGYLLYYPQMDKEVATSIYYLFIKINRQLYIDNIYLELKFDLILFVSELIVKKNITSNKLIEGAIETKFVTEYDEELDEVLDVCHELTNPDNFKEADVNYIIEYVNEKLTYIALYEEKSNLEHLIHKLNVNDVDNFGEFGENFKNLLQKITKDIGNSNNRKSSGQDYISCTEGQTNSIRKTIKELNNKTSVIKTGIKFLNLQLEGSGFKAGNVYLFAAKSGGGKSLWLLTLIRFYILYNKDIICRNTRLKPISLYISLENSVQESNCRLFEMFIPEEMRQGKEYSDFTPEEIQQLYTDYGWNNENQPYAIYYRKNKSINANDIENIIEDLEEKGYEAKLVIVDYIKRMKPIDPTNDLRIDLGEIVNDLMTLSKSKNVPVVTATQLNRQAVGTLEELSKKSTNVVQEITSANIGESGLMLENVSFAFIVHMETSLSTGIKYLTMNRIKSRGKLHTQENYFAIPYISPNSIIIDEDYGSKKTNSIHNIGDGLSQYNDPGVKTKTTRNLRKDSISADKTLLYTTSLSNEDKNFE